VANAPISACLQVGLTEAQIDWFSVQPPGKTIVKAYVESFNGTFRAECLDAHWFATLTEAKQAFQEWRREYDESRPHRALGERTPNEFAGQCAASRALTSLQAAENSLCR